MASDQPGPAQTITRDVPFIIDPSSGVLGRQEHLDGETNRSLITDQSFIRNTGFRGILRGVQYGTYHQKPSCLLVFDFLFVFDADSMPRFKAADIIIEFVKTKDGTVIGANYVSPNNETQGSVTVLNFCPRHIYGVPILESRKWSFGIAVPLLLSVGPVQTGPEASVQYETRFPKTHRAEIKGLPIASSGVTNNNAVKWSIRENRKENRGIPDRVTCAILVEYDGHPFQASVEVSVKTHMNITLAALPWSKDDPILFKPNSNLGTVTSKFSFEELQLEDWLGVVRTSTTLDFKDELLYESR
ncbi:hypothetical protein TWF730_004221 [Orbilia blumenaviensis]|uniref:Uncharacterized protein n=1 Tax=Orbilia blumenaviensis TaxID=1796055 RepID=A0AAV9U1A9_9PEZI